MYKNAAVVILSALLLLIACSQPKATPAVMSEEPTAVSTTPEITGTESSPMMVVSYDLGETVIIQDNYPEDSPFREMPVRLDGVIGVPAGEGQHPVVLILHGSHILCAEGNGWPCIEEQKNYEGFTYLVEELAKAGYLSLSINVNAEHTFDFGEPSIPGLRTKKLIDLHLAELAAANAGESDKFGIEITNRVDLSKLVWFGHSRGAEFGSRIIRDYDLDKEADAQGYGPVQGLIQIAPAIVYQDSLPVANVPLTGILPACDHDLIDLAGQQYYESTRFDPERDHFAAYYYVENTIHNPFNSILGPEVDEWRADRPTCTNETILPSEAHQKFLVQLATDFMQVLFGEPDAAEAAESRLGLLVNEPIPDRLYGIPAKINIAPVPNDQLILIQPQSETELSQNLVGGDVQMQGVTAVYCPQGYFGTGDERGSGPCKRVYFNQPGNPQQMVLEWDKVAAQWRTILPETAADISVYESVQLRVAIDPLSDLNSEGETQSFTMELVDANNQRAKVVVPEIKFPQGIRLPNEFVTGDTYSGHVYLQTIRIPLAEFVGIDLANIKEIALLFDQTESGTLFMADLAIIKGD